jgi:hypothetical protein
MADAQKSVKHKAVRCICEQVTCSSSINSAQRAARTCDWLDELSVTVDDDDDAEGDGGDVADV